VYYLQLLVSIINSEEITEELALQTISKDSFDQEESIQVHMDEKNESMEINTDVAINVTDTVSTNTTNTKVNCSLEKIYGPVEVLRIYKLA